jgi:hypothetical protein
MKEVKRNLIRLVLTVLAALSLVGLGVTTVNAWMPIPGNDWYARLAYVGGSWITDPINVLVYTRGYLHNSNELNLAGSNGLIKNTLSGLSTAPYSDTGCYDGRVYFNNADWAGIMSNDPSNPPYDVWGYGIKHYGCGAAERNHFRMWHRPGNTYRDLYRTGDDTVETTTYIAASIETVYNSYPITPPNFNFTGTSDKIFYRGMVTPAQIGTNCGNQSGPPNVPYNWKFTFYNVPTGFSLTNAILTDGARGTWRNGVCNSANHWPMKVVQLSATSFDIYVAPWEAGPDKNPNGSFTYSLYYSNSGTTARVTSVERCTAVHCLSGDTFNRGRDVLFADLERGFQGKILNKFGFYLGNNAQIDGSLGFKLQSDGWAKLMEVSPRSVLSLSYARSNTVRVGTNCSSPASPSTGVTYNWKFSVRNVPAGYIPVSLNDGGSGTWISNAWGCSPDRKWPMYVDIVSGGFDVYVAPYNANQANGEPWLNYYLRLRNLSGNVTDVMAKLR